MVTTLKKITRIGIYSVLFGILGLFGFLFSKNKREYHINLNPLSDDVISSAHAELSDSGDGGDSGSSSDGSGGSDM